MWRSRIDTLKSFSPKLLPSFKLDIVAEPGAHLAQVSVPSPSTEALLDERWNDNSAAAAAAHVRL